MRVSVLIPAYNEKKTIMDVLDLVRALEMDKEIIIVDDCSTDGTREILKQRFSGAPRGDIRVFYHGRNMGKGAALRTALEKASGEYVIVQDADLEYSPHDIVRLVKTAAERDADAVYGSRFMETWKSTSLVHFCINSFLTSVSNLLFGGGLTDMETCYKLIRTDLLRELGIQANSFEFEPEVTARLLKKGVRIIEVPVSYRGRSYDEGKKITWKDGIQALTVMLKLKATLR